MTLIELPRRKAEPRIFIEPPAGFGRSVNRALDALGDLPDNLHLPGLDDLADALIALADELDGDPDAEREPEDSPPGPKGLPLFAFAARRL